MTNNEEKLSIVIEGKDNASDDLKTIITLLQEMSSRLYTTMLASTTMASQVGVSMKKVKDSTEKTGKSMKKAFTKAKLIAVFTMLTRTVLKSIKASSDYIENLNLFEVAMGRNIKMAHQFTSAISENFGMDKSEVIRYMGAFSNLAESMGNTAKNAYAVSESLTTIGYDLASLWNISTASAMEKLQAGLVGQTKPLRSIGIDTTYATLQMYAFELGIKEQVKVLSQSDKQLLRTIAIMRQASSSWGDMAKTIETPANQMRVFKAQIDKVSRALGNLFLGLFGKILPYINAFLMIIYELLSALGRILGFKLPTYDANNSFGGIQDDVEGVDGAVKDLNKSLGLMDFDELHNVNTKDASGAGGYTAGGYGDLLGSNINEIMTEYDKKMESIKMKALEIRDTIMEWLGYTKLTNAETGEVDFKFNKITSGTIIAGLIGIGTALGTIYKVFKIGKGISMLFGGGGAIAGTTAKVGLLSKAFTGLAGILGISAGALGLILAGLLAIGAGIVYLNLSPAIKQIDEFKGATEKTTNALKPLFEGIEDVQLSIKKIDFSNAILTDADVNDINKRITNVTDSLSKGLIEKKKESIDTFNEMFKRGFLSEEEQKRLLDITEKTYQQEEQIIKDTKDRINTILEEAKKRGTKLKDSEVKELLDLSNTLKEKSVTILSESEKEANLILGRMTQNAKALSADQASKIIQDSAEVRDTTIQNAQDRYTQEMEAIKALNFDGSAESQALKQKMIDDATATRDETIKKAQGMHSEVYNEFARQNKDIADYIDKDTGKIKSKWRKFWDDVANIFKKNKYDLRVTGTFSNGGGGGGNGGGVGFAKGGVIGLASGGLITKPMMYRGVMTGENYRKEAIIPLQRTDIVSQFASNISDNIVGALGAINDQPIVNQFYVDGIKVTESVNKRTKEFNNMYGKNIA